MRRTLALSVVLAAFGVSFAAQAQESAGEVPVNSSLSVLSEGASEPSETPLPAVEVRGEPVRDRAFEWQQQGSPVQAAPPGSGAAADDRKILLSNPALVEVDVESVEGGSAAEGGDSVGQKVLDYIGDRFWFASYGRVQPSINPVDGSPGRQTRLIAPSPRIDEGSYVELTLGYVPYRDERGVEVEVVTTLALDGAKLFHFDGNWDANLAVRNLYVEARNLWIDGLRLWAGSRMYRGDDIYLLDFWPLDNLNTYGGGVGWHGKTRTNIDLHFGVNRLTNSYQFQVVEVVDERFVGEREVVFLDRQRFIASLKVEQLFGREEGVQFKAKLYGEVHAIGEGEYLQTQPEEVKKLPSDIGWLVGGQFGVSNFLGESFANVFVKYAGGLAAYGEMAIPFGISTDLRAAKARQFLFGVSSGLDFHYVNMLLGGYVRYFRNANGIDEDFDDGVEGVWNVRITGRVGRYFAPGIELSQQLRRPNGLSPVTQTQDLGSIFKLSLLPAVRFGEGMLSRPEIRLNYTVSFLNEAARNMFPERDRLRKAEVVHFLGIAAEWWFNL